MNVKFDASRVFFTSDTHFNHTNIIKYCQRPFRDIYEMNETLIANWNNVVAPDDIVFHLGDFCLGGADEWMSGTGFLTVSTAESISFSAITTSRTSGRVSSTGLNM